MGYFDIYDTRTFSGSTTTVTLRIGYWLRQFNFPDLGWTGVARLVESVASFSSNGFGNVANISANHFQIGQRTDNNNWAFITDGRIFATDRTNRSFSRYDRSGSVIWTKSPIIYTSVSSLFAGGGIGSNYTVFFVWVQGGGGQFFHEEVRVDVTYGQVFPT